jgi:hypothetical protein
MQRYVLPHVCARCATGVPTGTWNIKGPTKVTQGSAAVVMSTPVLAVPICSSCRGRLTGTIALIWVVAVALGAIAFFSINGFKVPGPDRARLVSGAVVGLIAALAGAALGHVLMRSELTIGILNPEHGTIHFLSQAYQRLFNEMNFVPGAALEPETDAPSQPIASGDILRPLALCLLGRFPFRPGHLRNLRAGAQRRRR